ncbi:MAG: response regulator [Ignavibacteriaceae bacterium]|jgi:CheY-like chemotaxis protein|nr:response regulator [Ignavibacteriaceae bacterium]
MNSNEIEILFVEDNPDDAELTLKALKKNKIANKVFLVGDGEEALDFIFAKGKFTGRNTEQNPKLILLDLKLPKIGGIEVLREIKANEKTKNIPVVVLTSSKEEMDIEKCYNLGVNSYIVKPIAFDMFMKVISDLGMYWLILNQPSI